MSDQEPRSLKATFAAAEEKRLSLENSPPSPADYADTVSAAIKLYQSCLSQISLLSLFSSNEGLEDLNTNDLPYLLVNYHLAELIQKIPSPTPSPAERKHILAQAREAYERYLHLLDSYEGLLNPTYKKLLERYTDSPTDFSVVSSASDPNARRNAKIANFKAEKELRQKLAYLRQRPEYAAADLELDDDESISQSRGGGGGGGSTGDEELVRSVHLAHLDLCTHLTFQALESLNRELEVLNMAPREPASLPSAQLRNNQAGNDGGAQDDLRRRQGGGAADRDYSDRLDMPFSRLQGILGGSGPILSKEGRPLRPFTLTGTRQEIAKGVFRPGHNLPTMSIDEYLEEERRRGGIIEGGGEASWKAGEKDPNDEDDYEKLDAETMKARAWDEFVEANPKGSGNTLNRG
ncbi:TAP42-like protein [Neurospora crassa]|uniref:TOR signaling pathway regulator n=1 Tax=Neurospora crassa (strain ATCC 24698 / 74-OR23-1A / CBS 708.71 / DSM 1257 / FGSC 987) TaxID=367110 RepID=Q7S8J9_NEUCR|nr:TOR signaling pathway regulator [Neurospora crassa OR74A]EAA32660.1 TOR signaling pathway regulator [Neurospora crassa OR74A]KHE79509.1 TAP42-like protein [Neurospora crassa]|eukprot:XP_961896.1 TOR signaling pathway regulator [Neurospora crassa OR74A]